jgi:hypothetical protein
VSVHILAQPIRLPENGVFQTKSQAVLLIWKCHHGKSTPGPLDSQGPQVVHKEEGPL